MNFMYIMIFKYLYIYVYTYTYYIHKYISMYIIELPQVAARFPGWLDLTCSKASVAAFMAVYCHGKRRQVQLHDGYITTTSVENDDVLCEIQELSVMKVVADAETSRNMDVLPKIRWTQVFGWCFPTVYWHLGWSFCRCSQYISILGSLAGRISLSIFIWFATEVASP